MIAALKKLIGDKHVLSKKEDILPYSFDGTAALKQLPTCVVFPTSVEEVSKVVAYANNNQIPLVCRGSGTGLSGGSIPVEKCIVLCLLKLNRILEVDNKNLTMLVEPGAITKDIMDTAGANDLFYPPDPSSNKVSTIGGNVAENSGGLRGLKYGITRDYVMALEVVLPNGEVVWFGNKCVKDVAGYSLKDLFIGSEGTLGIVTKVLLKLLPKPEARKTMLAYYDDMETAADTISKIIENKIIPCTLEFLDRKTIECVEAYAKVGLPTDIGALLLMETDGHPKVVEEEAKKMMAIATEHGAQKVIVAKTEAEANKLTTARRSAFSALARLKPTTILEDVTVPRSELAKMVKFIENTAEEFDLSIATFGHIGDGNLHPTFLTNEKNEEEMHRVEEALEKIVDYTLKLGGTITGEHGVGLAKKKFLPKQFNHASFELLKQFKATLDPNGILNPGKIF